MWLTGCHLDGLDTNYSLAKKPSHFQPRFQNKLKRKKEEEQYIFVEEESFSASRKGCLYLVSPTCTVLLRVMPCSESFLKTSWLEPSYCRRVSAVTGKGNKFLAFLAIVMAAKELENVKRVHYKGWKVTR